MKAADVISVLQLLSAAGIQVHVDGGWGVDALLGQQTRPHSDLDIAIQHRDVPELREILSQKGFREIPRDDTWECNFVLADPSGRQLDVHSYTFDENGNCIFGLPYPVESLTGRGSIDGFEVDCISAEWMVKFHTGYPLDENDYRDVTALCRKFGIELPSEYHSFTGSSKASGSL